MAKKVKTKKKGGKRLLSIIFHLVVLVLMVNLYDAAREMLKKDVPKPPKEEKATKAKGANKTSDGTFEMLMAEKRRKAKEDAEKAAQEKK